MSIPNLWEPFGLRGSPFFQDELRPTDEDGCPITLFVGRMEEVSRITRRIASDRSTRTIVQGDPGVGKTSFVNRLKADVAAAGVLTHEHPVRITSDTSRASFLADVLRTLTRIRVAFQPRRKKDDDFWKRIARLLEGEDTVSGSLSAFGVGAGMNRGFIAPLAPPDSLFEHLGEALKRIAGEFGAPVLIHVNNLENLGVEEAHETAVLLRDIRDYLLLPGAHWVFVGATGVEESVFRVYTQVGGIFPEAETLQPLNGSEVGELLALRYNYLAVAGRKVVPPIESADAARLYGLYHGDLRNFLRLLGDAAERGLGLRGVDSMTVTEVVRHAAPGYERSLRRRIGDTDFGYLARIVGASGGMVPEFRVTDAARFLDITQASASQLVERLTRAGVIRQARVQGRSVYYRPTGEALVGLAMAPDAEPAR
jgi:DNA-binding transcriptional ArsR family regulator